MKTLLFQDNKICDDYSKLLNSRAYLYGDSVFTSFYNFGANSALVESHKERLKSQAQIQFSLNLSNSIDVIFEYIKENIETGHYIRVSLSPVSDHPVLNQREFVEKDFLFSLHSTKALLEMTSVDCELVEVDYPNMNIKSNQYGAQLRSLSDNMPIFYDEKGVIESLSSNLILEKNGELFTPYHPLLLKGIIREKLINTFKVKEVLIRSDEVVKFDAGFLTNSVKLITLINSVDGVKFERPAKMDHIFKTLLEHYE